MIRVGLVGFGLAGKVFHAPLVSAVEGLELAAVVERKSRIAEAAYPGITTYPSLESMLGDTTLEVIVVATPDNLMSPTQLRRSKPDATSSSTSLSLVQPPRSPV